MAQKARVPNPPKRSQGPQRRSTSAAPGVADQRRRTLYLFAGAGAVVLVAVLAIVFLMGGGGSSNERPALEAAGFTLQSFPAQPSKPDHSDVPTLQTKPKWNSSPPTSGPHYAVPAVWDFYDEEVPLVQTVHNLQHGGVVIHYGPQFPKAEVEKIREWYGNDPNGLVVAPLKTNKNKVTLSAWTAPDASTGTRDRGRGWLATGTKFNKAAFDAFVQAHRYKGPERLLPEQLAPGN
jgi:Protein of unknown function (DUF3105)